MKSKIEVTPAAGGVIRMRSVPVGWFARIYDWLFPGWATKVTIEGGSLITRRVRRRRGAAMPENASGRA